MFVVDTNILAYAAHDRAAEHAACRSRLSNWTRSPGAWYLTWGIAYEFLRLATHPKIFSRPLSARQAWSFIEAVLASPGAGLLTPGDRHAAVLCSVLDEIPLLAGNIMHDVETVVLMREHGIRRIYTRDTHFHRFSFIETVDPLSE
jgi:hypothetical protein